jgi:hypothetical protein
VCAWHVLASGRRSRHSGRACGNVQRLNTAFKYGVRSTPMSSTLWTFFISSLFSLSSPCQSLSVSHHFFYIQFSTYSFDYYMFFLIYISYFDWFFSSISSLWFSLIWFSCQFSFLQHLIFFNCSLFFLFS